MNISVGNTSISNSSINTSISIVPAPMSLHPASIIGSEETLTISSKDKVVIDGELYIRERSLFELIADIVDLMNDPNQLANWLISPNANEREFAKTIANRLERKNEKLSTNQNKNP